MMRRMQSYAAGAASRFRPISVWLGAIGAAVLVVAAPAGAQVETAEPVPVSGYLRVDTDRYGTQIWFGATHPCRGLDIASDVLLVNATAELDVGPSWSLGKGLTISPMAGLVFDFERNNLTTLVPQLYVYWTGAKWYLESWENAYLGLRDEYRPHYFTDRTFLLYSLSEACALGPHAELSVNLEDTGEGGSRLTSLILGGAVDLDYGKASSLLLFLGRETRKAARSGNDGIGGRVTFVRQW